MKKILLSLLVLTFMILVVEDANAQRRGKKKRRVRTDDTEQAEERRSRDRDDDEFMATSFRDKLNIEIKPGNLFISSVTSLSVKSNIGYKFNKTFSAGLGGKFFYVWSSQGSANSVSRTDYGGFAYARAKISQELYLVAEYNTLSLGNFFSDIRTSLSYPAAGIGYMRPGLDWSSGFELLIVFNDAAREALELPFEYWFNFSHNF